MKKLNIKISLVVLIVVVLFVAVFLLINKSGQETINDPAFNEFKTEYIYCNGYTSEDEIKYAWDNGGYSNLLCN